jgi:hypothetical protein
MWVIAHLGAPFLKCIVAVCISERPQPQGSNLVGQSPSICSPAQVLDNSHQVTSYRACVEYECLSLSKSTRFVQPENEPKDLCLSVID